MKTKYHNQLWFILVIIFFFHLKGFSQMMRPNTSGLMPIERKMKMEKKGGLHAFYKRYISSQDGETCSFYPSCSSYMAQAIHRKGLFIGLLAGIDRITRCNGNHQTIYQTSTNDKLLDQP